MKPFDRLFLHLFLAASALAVAPVRAAEPVAASAPADHRAIVKEDKSPHEFPTTVKRLKEQLAKDGWNLLTEIDLGGVSPRRACTCPAAR